MAVLLALAPLLLFLATLVAGRYVGEKRIARLAAGCARPRGDAPAAPGWATDSRHRSSCPVAAA